MADDKGPNATWAEYMRGYRQNYGNQSFKTVEQKQPPPPGEKEKHFPRSALIPLGKYENKGYYMVGDEAQPSYNDPNRQEWLRRKGMGDVTLLKETDTSDSSRRADTNNMFVGGRMRMEPPKQRVQLFKERVPSASEDAKKPNFEDDWVGNPGLKPNKGRKLTHPPADPKGRTDGLFTVLKSDTANPGQVKEDGWIGNMSTDPASGKARATPPEERRGRTGLHDIIQQRILTDPDKLKKLQPHNDKALADAWIGTPSINPQKGRGAGECAKDYAHSHLLGGVIRMYRPPNVDILTDWALNTELKNVKGHGPADQRIDHVGPMIRGEGPAEKLPEHGVKKYIAYDAEHPKMSYAKDALKYKPMTDAEKEHYRLALTDAHHSNIKNVRPIPGSINPSTGTEMLAWKPEERIASVVAPGGKGMKEERMTFNASQRRPIPEPVRTSWYY